MIHVAEFHAPRFHDLENELNDIKGRIITVLPEPDSWYKVIYES